MGISEEAFTLCLLRGTMTQELSAPTHRERILELLVEQNTTEMMAPVNIIMSNCLLRCPPGQAGVGEGERGEAPIRKDGGARGTL